LWNFCESYLSVKCDVNLSQRLCIDPESYVRKVSFSSSSASPVSCSKSGIRKRLFFIMPGIMRYVLLSHLLVIINQFVGFP
jgi:hypothetical protein